ncbi:hypothetical protein JMJ55_13925 [Belnapia sp. T6]|uniref:Uncharacterized protein n=1 Tax=Belnapia mucosa TaxID=2804532 RepID=A0ABS1V7X9_9PROT|nr:hypothetical protein [Belnapia mucosa]MBL6456428.1 hypothetical protein [Belnapia mucosa]
MASVRWLAFAALYLVFAGQLSTGELVAAAVIGLLTLLFARILARIATHPLRLRAPWPQLLRGVLASLAQETGRAAAWLLRPGRLPEGAVLPQPFAPGGEGPADTVRRGLALLSLSVSPNGLVLAPDYVTETLPLHRLDAGQPVSSERCWPP